MTKQQMKKKLAKANVYLNRAEYETVEILKEIQKKTNVELFRISNIPSDSWCIEYNYIDEYGEIFCKLCPVEYVFDLLESKSFLTQEDLSSISI